MNPLNLLPRVDDAGGAAPTILFLGAHCDDIEIGCGATLLGLRKQRPDAEVHWAIFTSSEARGAEAMEGARRFLGEDGLDRVQIESFRDGFLPYEGAAVKEVFERLKTEVTPDLIFTHYRHDLHQDHRLVNELTWNTWRNHLILEYEIPKWDGDLGQPNTFIHASEADANAKAAHILAAYTSQAEKAWLDEDTIKGLMRLRGVESNAPERFAEAFYVRKTAAGF